MCAVRKFILPEFLPTPEPLNSLLFGESADSELFLRNTRQSNFYLQMTLSGVIKTVQNNEGP